MKLEESSKLFDRIEKNLQRDYVISTDFRGILSGQSNRKRRITIAALIFATCVYSLRAFIGMVCNDTSPLHVYSLNPLFGYGFLGKFMSGVYVGGYTGMIFHSVMIFMKEGTGKLIPWTNIRGMFAKLKKPTTAEIKDFTLFLKALVYVQEVCFIGVTLPMALFRAVGAVVTAYRLQSLTFLLWYIPVYLVFIVLQQYNVGLYGYVHMTIAHSTTYFKIRLKRSLKVLRKALFMSRKLTISERQERVRIFISINRALVQMQETLDEIRDHNETINFWLRDELLLIGGLFALFLVFIVGDIEWYHKILPFVCFASLALGIGISFSNAAELFIEIRSMAKILHSCQSEIQREKLNSRHQSAPLTQRTVHPIYFLKTKYQILRMIHRVSSPFLRIGYTEGDGESFSPASVGQFISTVVLTSLMFMNSKYSSLRDIFKI